MCCKSMFGAKYLRQNVICLGCGPFVATEDGYGYVWDGDKPDAVVMSKGIRGNFRELVREDPDPATLKCPRCGETAIVANLAMRPVTTFEWGLRISGWEIYDVSGPSTVNWARWMKAIDGHKFNVAKSRGYATTGKGSMTAAKRDPVVAKAVKDSVVLKHAFMRIFNDVLNARRLVNARMEEFMSSLGYQDRIFVSGPLAHYLKSHQTGLMVLRGYKHRSPVDKNHDWKWHNVVVHKIAAGIELDKSEKMILWLKSEMPMKELMRLTNNFGKRMALRGKTREEVLRNLFPDSSLAKSMIEFKEEFMTAFGEVKSHGNVQHVPDDFQDHDPGVEDEVNLEVDLFEDRLEEFLDVSEEEIEEDE